MEVMALFLNRGHISVRRMANLLDLAVDDLGHVSPTRPYLQAAYICIMCVVIDLFPNPKSFGQRLHFKSTRVFGPPLRLLVESVLTSLTILTTGSLFSLAGAPCPSCMRETYVNDADAKGKLTGCLDCRFNSGRAAVAAPMRPNDLYRESMTSEATAGTGW